MSGLEDEGRPRPSQEVSESNSSEPSLPERSSSPALKRPASDLEAQPAEPSSDPAQPISHSERRGSRHKREVSVDMFAHEGEGSGKTGSTTSGSEGTLVSESSYLTPRSGTTSAAPSQAAGSLPSIDEQVAKVTELSYKPIKDGQKGFLVSKEWLGRVLARTSEPSQEKFDKSATEGDVGPVDNTGLNLVTDPSVGTFKDEAGQAFVPLTLGLTMGVDFEVLPQEAWTLIVKWYGIVDGSPVITRYVHNTDLSGEGENLQYELYPPIFTILKLSNPSASKSSKAEDTPPVKVLASRHEPFNSFLKRVKLLVGIDLKTRVRVWRILGGLGETAQSGIITPAQSRSVSPAPAAATVVDAGSKLVLDMQSFVSLQVGSEREALEARDETANEKYNGHSSIGLAGLNRNEVLLLEEQIGGPGGGEWVSDAAPKSVNNRSGVSISVTKDGATTVQDRLKPKATTPSGRSSPALPAGGMLTRGRQRRDGKARGTTGLSNLGNTCYMNSALQCVRSVEELTQYFIRKWFLFHHIKACPADKRVTEDEYKAELNPDNPLSHHGQVAKAYALLLHEIYADNAPSSLAPRNFKNTVGRYGPSFSGYAQQDSQEFLGFLLDGLQEDLNRIYKKPYIEKPDSTDEMVSNPQALREMADKCWDIYKARNDSVITDLFAGMYKSTVVCPVCDKVSIIFDPFNNLTLQLPIESLWSKEMCYFPLHSRPVRVAVDIDKNATIGALKEYVAKKMNVDPKKTVIAEIYKAKFYKMFDESRTISEQSIQAADDIGVYELEDVPSNYPPPKKKGQKVRSLLNTYPNSDEEEDVPEGESPLAESMLVPVFHRTIRSGSSRFQQRAMFGFPSYIIIHSEEAKDYDTILRKVLAKVDTMTTLDILRREDGSEDASTTQEDSDTVVMNEDDAASDSKIKTRSVEGEDGMIDVSMQDPETLPTSTQAAGNNSAPANQQQESTLPRVLRPGSFVPPELQNLFEMKYFAGGEMVPTGWSSLDENKNYPTISSRMPRKVLTRPLARLGTHQPRFGDRSSVSSDEDIDDPPQHVNEPIPRINSDADSDSDDLPSVENLYGQRNSTFSTYNKHTARNKRGLITYSQKGKQSAMASDTGESTSRPLIRLGEGIVLDWGLATYESLFEGTETDSNAMRGAPTWERIQVVPDPVLTKQRQLRSQRRRQGVSLGDCLDEFGKEEILSENDAWYCPRCKEHRRAGKTFELWKSPDILVIHLKRFSANRGFRDKIDVLVDFPVEGLDLTGRVALHEEGKSAIYDLFAVDNHYGGLGGGHYTAYARNFIDGRWYEYNGTSFN